MRAWWLTLLLLSSVQGAVLEDGIDDVVITVDGEVVSPAQGEPWTLLDLQALSIQETPFELTFQVNLTRLARDPNVFLVDSADYVVYFRHGLIEYEVDLNRNMGFGTDVEPSYYATLIRYYPSGGFSLSAYDAVADEDAATFAVSVPRTELIDDMGRIPLPGHVFEDLRVEAWNSFTGSDAFYRPVRSFLDAFGVTAGPDSLVRVLDMMPDEGVSTYAIRKGFGQGEGVTLSTQEPLRVSNGEATTMVFELVLAHEADGTQPFRLTTIDAPAGWDVWFPVQDVDIPVEGRTVPVVVRVPFSHQHGSILTATVRADSITSDAWAEADIGIHYTQVPQPAGHHNLIHLHSAKEPFFLVINGVPGDETDPIMDGFAWFNTLEDDEADEAAPASSGPRPIANEMTAGWSVPLQPSLAMGLDVALGTTGDAVLDFTAQRDLEASRLIGEVFHVDAGGNETILMTMAAQGPITAGVGQSFTVEAEITPTGVPVVPYSPGGNLVLRFGLVLREEGTLLEQLFGGQAQLLGGTLALPLDEYHDSIDEAFAADQAVRLAADEQERRAAPGSLLVFEASLHHARVEPADFDLRLHGDDGWAQIITPEGTRAGAEELPVQVVVRIPENAPDGRKDMLLEAADAADPLRRSLLRLVVDVDSKAALVDESALARQQTEDRDSPTPAVVPLLALVAALGASRARRGDVRP